MNAAEAKRETDSLAKRYPKKGIDPTIPEGIREMLVDREKNKLTPASKYAKGGVTRADGCAQRGKTKGKMR
jgi:hypothetical protein